MTELTIIGNLARDPELRYTAQGKPVLNMTIMESRRHQDVQTREWVDDDPYVWPARIWGKAAENAAQNLRKGTRVVATGKAYQEVRKDEHTGKTISRTTGITVTEIALSVKFGPHEQAEQQPTPRTPPAPHQEAPAYQDPYYDWPDVAPTGQQFR